MSNEVKEIIKNISIELVGIHKTCPHIASSLSALEIISILYFEIMNIKSVGDPSRDRFILSKGHAVSALYGVLTKKGFLNEPLDDFSKDGSRLFSHPVRNYSYGIEVSSGSLGHGLAIATGIAFAAKKAGETYRTFVVMGDGECQEGSVWEAAILATRLELGNIIVIIDANGLQDSEYVGNIQPVNTFRKKWEAFGWNVSECRNVIEELPRIIKEDVEVNKPLVIIAYTTKGKGIKEIENQLHAHHYVVPEEKVEYLIEEIKQQYEKSIE